ncbi:hypothetical protein B2I51_002532 [Escherichia coli]|nr:hypothetical protein [Escherichia coli]
MIIDIEKALKRELTPGATPGEEAYYRPKPQRTNDIPVAKRTVNKNGQRSRPRSIRSGEKLKTIRQCLQRLEIMGCQAYVDQAGQVWVKIGNSTRLQKGLPCGVCRPMEKTDRLATGREIAESWLKFFLDL